MGREHLAHPKYRADIDGLRAVAVILVVGFHVFPNFIPGGFIGVDVFFVISGYLISTIIMQSALAGRFSYREFYVRRIRRIFPALLAVLLAVLVAGWFIMMADQYAQTAGHVLAGAGFVSNLLFWSEAGYFETRAMLKPLLHLWSLGIEEQFYIVWPLVVVLALRFRRTAGMTLSAVLVASLLACLWITQTDAVAAYYSPLTRFWELAAGGLLAYAHVRGLDTTRIISANRQAIAGLVLFTLALLVTDKTQPFPGWRALLPVVGAVLLISAGQRAWVNARVLSMRGMVWVGLISYPLYLWHWPLLSFVYLVDGGTKLSRDTRLMVVAGSFALAWLTYRLIEKPLRSSGNIRLVVASLCLAMAGIVTASAIVFFTQGMPARAVNTNPENVFLYTYRSIVREAAHQAYREECNFYNWQNDGARDSIDTSCLQVGERETFLLWGDSHAQAVSQGLRDHLPQDIKLVQITTGGCRPALRVVPRNGANVEACTRANEFAKVEIARLRPARVFMTQAAKHDETDWREIAAFVRSHGGQLVVIGPLPVWRPGLPDVIVKYHFSDDAVYVSEGLDRGIFALDRRMKDTYPRAHAAQTGVTYVSLIDTLCIDTGCRARTADGSAHDLMAWDHAHLTPSGSQFVGRSVLAPYLDEKMPK